MKVEVVSRSMVKPCTPTPPHLRTYNISIMDELNQPFHMIRILYYPPEALNGKQINLKESLAQILPTFYPLAGRYLKEKRVVDCNDEGALYIEAQVDCDLLPLIRQHDLNPDQLNHLLPVDMRATDEPTDPILSVQVNRFQCGGLAIGVCGSHRIQDSCTLGLFLIAWANLANGRGGEQQIIRPDFDSAAYFPAKNEPHLGLGMSRSGPHEVGARRFVFNKNAVSKLREAVGPGWRSDRPPSRFVIVSAFLTQVLLRADGAKRGADPRPCIVGFPINCRNRTVPPVSKHAFGTWVSVSNFECSTQEESLRLSKERNFTEVASGMYEALARGVKECASVFTDKELANWILDEINRDTVERAEAGDYNLVWITDWSKFGAYELDFGFGKPVWVSLALYPVHKFIILMNTKENDGIEAWVNLHESEMPYFERDEQLRLLTNSNYS